MSDANPTAGAPPVPPAAAPVKAPLAVKIPMKVPMKLPMKAPMVVKMPVAAPTKVAPKPTAVAPKPAAPKPVVRRTGMLDEDDDDALLGVGTARPAAVVKTAVVRKPAAAPPAVKKAAAPVQKAPPVQRKRARSPSVESVASVNSLEAELQTFGKYNPANPEEESIYNWAIRNDFVEGELSDEEEEEVKLKPKQPMKIKFSKQGDIKSQCVKAIAKLDEAINKAEMQLQIKETGKNVSLTTSKTNYIDPRISCAFSKKSGLKLTKIFSKTLIDKFPWAEDCTEGADFRF